jgi:hypothetical protein
LMSGVDCRSNFPWLESMRQLQSWLAGIIVDLQDDPGAWVLWLSLLRVSV